MKKLEKYFIKEAEKHSPKVIDNWAIAAYIIFGSAVVFLAAAWAGGLLHGVIN